MGLNVNIAKTLPAQILPRICHWPAAQGCSTAAAAAQWTLAETFPQQETPALAPRGTEAGESPTMMPLPPVTSSWSVPVSEVL